jgi:protein-glutamine gamma-glutamyltransferase
MPYSPQEMGMPGMGMPGMGMPSSGSGMPDTQTLQSQTLGGIDVNRGFEGMPPHEAKYRKAVVSNSLVFHKKMSSGRLAFGRHMDSQYFNTKYWEPVYVGGSQFWKLKDGASKAEALNDFINPSGGKYKIDCAAAINLIMLKSKLDVVGESNFNKRLPVLLIRGWKTVTQKNGEAHEYKTLEKWAGNEYMPGSVAGLKTGDYVYFKNHPMMEGTPEQGENAIFLGMDQWGRPVFFGLNIGIMRGTVNQYGILSSERGSIDPDSLKSMAE